MRPSPLSDIQFRSPLEQFVDLAVTAPSADNSQPWTFSIHDDQVICKYRHSGTIDDPFGGNGHGTLIAAGALHENIDRLLKCCGLPSSRINRQAEWEISFNTPSSPIPECDLVSAIQNRHTNRHRFAPPSASSLDKLPKSHSGASRVVLLTHSSAIKTTAKAVRQCSEARFNSRNLHEWLFSSLRWTPEGVAIGDGLDLNTIDLPPGGKSFMRFISPWSRMEFLNHFGIYKLLAIADSAPISQSSCLMAIVGGKTPDEIWEAGRHLQRLWLELNQRGLAVHPYYVITDLTNRLDTGRIDAHWAPRVQTAKTQISRVLELGSDEQLHMLLRVGQATKQAVRSRRKPVKQFFA
ncbi:MAG: hypothetical protein Q8S26_01195 [Azonexus sp.]|nr:hypothetical protein [Azonexus sp.]